MTKFALFFFQHAYNASCQKCSFCRKCICMCMYFQKFAIFYWLTKLMASSQAVVASFQFFWHSVVANLLLIVRFRFSEKETLIH